MFTNPFVRETLSSFPTDFPLSFEVISIECFEKIRHGQKIFPLKALKGYKCIYNELERKNSLPLIEQRRATSSTPNPRKTVATNVVPSPPIAVPSVSRSPPTSPKVISRPAEQTVQLNFQRSTIATNARGKLTRSSDSLLSPLTTTTHSFPTVHLSSNETMVMRYQTIQRYRTNFEILKPATVIAEEMEESRSNTKGSISDRRTQSSRSRLQIFHTQQTDSNFINIGTRGSCIIFFFFFFAFFSNNTTSTSTEQQLASHWTTINRRRYENTR